MKKLAPMKLLSLKLKKFHQKSLQPEKEFEVCSINYMSNIKHHLS